MGEIGGGCQCSKKGCQPIETLYISYLILIFEKLELLCGMCYEIELCSMLRARASLVPWRRILFFLRSRHIDTLSESATKLHSLVWLKVEVRSTCKKLIIYY